MQHPSSKQDHYDTIDNFQTIPTSNKRFKPFDSYEKHQQKKPIKQQSSDRKNDPLSTDRFNWHQFVDKRSPAIYYLK